MVKRIFAILLVAIICVFVLSVPFSAQVVNSDNADTFITSALTNLYFDSSPAYQGPISKNHNFVFSGQFIHYPEYRGTKLVDPNGFYVWFVAPTAEVGENQQFGFQLAIENVVYYPGFTPDRQMVFGDYTIYYKWFTYSQWLDVFSDFGSGLFPSRCSAYVRNTQDSSNFSYFSCGVSSYTIFSEFRSAIDALKSYQNGEATGYADGSLLVNSPFEGSRVYLSYRDASGWHDVLSRNVSFNVNDYISSNVIDLALIDAMNFDFSSIPPVVEQVKLSFVLSSPMNVGAFGVSAYNPSYLIETQFDSGGFPYGVGFSNDRTSAFGLIYPSNSVQEGNNIKYSYYFTGDMIFNNMDVYLNRDVLGLPINYGYVAYSVNDYQSLIDGYYNEGYTQGFQSGSDAGFAEGEDVGYENGYREGLEMAEKGDFTSLLTALVDVPIAAFYGLLDFNLLGINLSSFVLSILSLVLIIIVLKKVIL